VTVSSEANVLRDVKAVLINTEKRYGLKKDYAYCHFIFIFSPFSCVSLPSQIEFVTGTKKGTTTSAASTTTTTASTTVGGKEQL